MLTKKIDFDAIAAAAGVALAEAPAPASPAVRHEDVRPKRKPPKSPGRPKAPEARSRVLLGESLMNDLKAWRDAQEPRLGFKPSLAKTIALLLTTVKNQ